MRIGGMTPTALRIWKIYFLPIFDARSLKRAAKKTIRPIFVLGTKKYGWLFCHAPMPRQVRQLVKNKNSNEPVKSWSVFGRTSGHDILRVCPKKESFNWEKTIKLNTKTIFGVKDKSQYQCMYQQLVIMAWLRMHFFNYWLRGGTHNILKQCCRFFLDN